MEEVDNQRKGINNLRNEMMHRPVVMKELVQYLRTAQKPLAGELGKVEREANEQEVPIIPHETVVFMPNQTTKYIRNRLCDWFFF